MDEEIICSKTDSISVLDLNIRVHNALRRSGISEIGELIVLNDDQLFAVRFLGEKGVSEIRERLTRVTLIDNPFPTHEIEPLKEWSAEPQILINLGPPMIPCYEVVEWQQQVLARQMESRTLHPMMQFEGYRLGELVDVHSHTEGLYGLLLKILTAPISVSQELEHLLDNVSQRELDILNRRFCIRRQTLESVATDLGVTRERVRQIEKQAIGRVEKAASTLQLLRIRSAILFADDMDLSFAGWSQSLRRTGLLGDWATERFEGSNPVELMIIACELITGPPSEINIPESLNYMIKLHYDGKSSVAARVMQLSEALSPDAERLIRRHAQHSGAVSVDWLVKQEEIPFDRKQLKQVLAAKEFIDIGEGWHLSVEYMPHLLSKSHVFHNTLQKMFAYCGPLDERDIMFGMEHALSRKDFPVPPTDVISTILKQYNYLHENGKWYWEGSITEKLNEGEKIIVRTMIDNDDVAHRSMLAKAFIDSPLSFASLHGTLSRSPLFDNFEKGLYKLRGERPSSDDIESARSAKERIPVNLEVKRDTRGSIIIGANLGSPAIGNGTIVSEKLPNLEGDWNFVLTNGKTINIAVTASEIRGLSQAIKQQCCEVGDRVQLTFNLWDRNVTLCKLEDGD
ncbi:MAG: hypothetical protein OXG39_00275 [Chloroflexi bacterium]|nr:hypothetical protein [Chloroflexota bacterium]